MTDFLTFIQHEILIIFTA